jgi:hypothetical protein
LLIARRLRDGIVFDRGVHLIKFEVVGVPVNLGNARLVLGVAGVGHTLPAHALVRVGAGAGDVEVLVYVAALRFLLVILGDKDEAVPSATAVAIMVVVIAVVAAIAIIGRRRWWFAGSSALTGGRRWRFAAYSARIGGRRWGWFLGRRALYGGEERPF